MSGPVKVRECFLHAAARVAPGVDCREAWAAMNRKNAPWAAVVTAEGRLIGLLRREDLDGVVRVPETFVTAGELASKGRAAKRAVRISPDAELGEALLQMELAGADAAFVEATGRPPGVLELREARKRL